MFVLWKQGIFTTNCGNNLDTNKMQPKIIPQHKEFIKIKILVSPIRCIIFTCSYEGTMCILCSASTSTCLQAFTLFKNFSTGEPHLLHSSLSFLFGTIVYIHTSPSFFPYVIRIVGKKPNYFHIIWEYQQLLIFIVYLRRLYVGENISVPRKNIPILDTCTSEKGIFFLFVVSIVDIFLQEISTNINN